MVKTQFHDYLPIESKDIHSEDPFDVKIVFYLQYIYKLSSCSLNSAFISVNILYVSRKFPLPIVNKYRGQTVLSTFFMGPDYSYWPIKLVQTSANLSNLHEVT